MKPRRVSVGGWTSNSQTDNSMRAKDRDSRNFLNQKGTHYRHPSSRTTTNECELFEASNLNSSRERVSFEYLNQLCPWNSIPQGKHECHALAINSS